MTRRKIFFIIMTVLLAVLLILFFWWWLVKKPVVPAANVNLNTNQAVNAQISALPPPSSARIKEEQQYPLGLKQLAHSFAERFGSYSTDSGFKNFNDLKPFMTLKMRAEADKIILQTSRAGSYQGFDAKALSSELIAVDASQAVVMVKTQRARYTELGGEPSVSYADLRLKLVKTGDEWQVDEAQWQ